MTGEGDDSCLMDNSERGRLAGRLPYELAEWDTGDITLVVVAPRGACWDERREGDRLPDCMDMACGPDIEGTEGALARLP